MNLMKYFWSLYELLRDFLVHSAAGTRFLTPICSLVIFSSSARTAAARRVTSTSWGKYILVRSANNIICYKLLLVVVEENFGEIHYSEAFSLLDLRQRAMPAPARRVVTSIIDFCLTAEILLIKQLLVINHGRNCSSTEESSIQRSLRLLDVIRLRKFHKYFHMDLCIVLLTLSFLIDYHIFDL